MGYLVPSRNVNQIINSSARFTIVVPYRIIGCSLDFVCCVWSLVLEIRNMASLSSSLPVQTESNLNKPFKLVSGRFLQ